MILSARLYPWCLDCGSSGNAGIGGPPYFNALFLAADGLLMAAMGVGNAQPLGKDRVKWLIWPLKWVLDWLWRLAPV